MRVQLGGANEWEPAYILRLLRQPNAAGPPAYKQEIAGPDWLGVLALWRPSLRHMIVVFGHQSPEPARAPATGTGQAD